MMTCVASNVNFSLHSWFRLESETGSNCGTSPSLYASSLTQPCHPGVWMIWHTQHRRLTRAQLDIKGLLFSPGSPHFTSDIETIAFSNQGHSPSLLPPLLLFLLWLLNCLQIRRCFSSVSVMVITVSVSFASALNNKALYWISIPSLSLTSTWHKCKPVETGPQSNTLQNRKWSLETLVKGFGRGSQSCYFLSITDLQLPYQVQVHIKTEEFFDFGHVLI